MYTHAIYDYRLHTHTLHTYWHAHTRACPFTHLCVRKNCAFKDRPRYHPLPRNSLHVPARCHPTTVVLLFARRIDHVPFRSTCLLFFFSFLFFFSSTGTIPFIIHCHRRFPSTSSVTAVGEKSGSQRTKKTFRSCSNDTRL